MPETEHKNPIKPYTKSVEESYLIKGYIISYKHTLWFDSNQVREEVKIISSGQTEYNFTRLNFDSKSIEKLPRDKELPSEIEKLIIECLPKHFSDIIGKTKGISNIVKARGNK